MGDVTSETTEGRTAGDDGMTDPRRSAGAPSKSQQRGRRAYERALLFCRLIDLRRVWQDLAETDDPRCGRTVRDVAASVVDLLNARLDELEAAARTDARLRYDRMPLTAEDRRRIDEHRRRVVAAVRSGEEWGQRGQADESDWGQGWSDDAADGFEGDDPRGDNPTAGDSESELRGPADLAAAIGFVPPAPPRAKDAGRKSELPRDMRLW